MSERKSGREEPLLQIGEVADRTGVTQRTLRFYEERGLLKPPTRMEGGFRLYSEDDVARVTQIRRLQDLLGLTLAEIKDMVEAEEVKEELRATYRPDRPIDGPMITAHRDAETLLDLEAACVGHHDIRCGADRQDPNLRRIDDRRELIDTEHAEV